MLNRQQQLILHLAYADGPLTSKELAQMLNVSDRTVKKDMHFVEEELQKNGARLISKQNRGYSLEITDLAAYNNMCILLVLGNNGNPMEEASADKDTLYIARKLMASEKGVKTDDLEEELYLSKGALRKSFHDAVEFCKSYGLQVAYSAGHGYRVSGDEYRIRMALVELLEQHFHKRQLGRTGEEYARWVQCDYQERNDIRHTFLKILRESGYSVRDSVSQRLAMYLIIARSRREGGKKLTLPQEWIDEIKSTPLYPVACETYGELARLYAGYEMEETEAAFLAMYLLCNLDADLERNPEEIVPFLYREVCVAANEALDDVRERSGCDFSVFPNALPLLIQLLQPMLLGKRYHLDGRHCFDYGHERVFLQYPVCVYHAHLIGDSLEKSESLRLSTTDYSILACYVGALLNLAEYERRPLRLLSTNAIGTEFARMQVDGLKQRYPQLIESITSMELYELRKLNPEDYDGVLVGNATVPGESKLFGYNYSWPGIPIYNMDWGRDFNLIYNEMLINAWQTDSLVPQPDQFHVETDFLYHSPEQFFQFISQRHAKEEIARIQLEKLLKKWNDAVPMSVNGVVYIIAPLDLCREPCFEIYRLKKKEPWGKEKTDTILFMVMDGRDIRESKAVHACLDMLNSHQEKLPDLMEHPAETWKALLRESLKNY